MALDSVGARSKRRKLPIVDTPQVSDDELRRNLEAVREHLRMYEGDSGAPKERFVTIKELELAGLINTKVQGNFALIDKVLGDPVSQGQQAGGDTIIFQSSGGGGSKTLAGLSDTAVAGAAAKDFLQYSGGIWADYDLFGSFNTWTGLQSFRAGFNVRDAVTTQYVYFGVSDGDLNLLNSGVVDVNLVGLNLNLSEDYAIEWNDTELAIFGAPTGGGAATIGHSVVIPYESLATGFGGTPSVYSATGNSTYEDVTGAALTGLDSGSEYLIMVQAAVGNGGNTTANIMRLTNNGTSIADSVMTFETRLNSRIMYNWMGVVTVSGTIQLQYNTDDTSAEVGGITLTAIKVADLGTKFTHSTSTSSQGIANTVDGSELLPSLTLGDGTKDYLILGCIRVNTGNYAYEAWLADDDVLRRYTINGIHDFVMGERGYSTSDGDRFGAFSRLVENPNGVEYSVYARDKNNVSMTVDYAFMCAIDLSAFEEVHYAYKSDLLNTASGNLTQTAFTQPSGFTNADEAISLDAAVISSAGDYGMFWSVTSAQGASGDAADHWLTYTKNAGSEAYLQGTTEVPVDSDTPNEQMHLLWGMSEADIALLAADQIDAELTVYEDQSATTNYLAEQVIVLFKWSQGDPPKEFTLGNTVYETNILGTQINLQAPTAVTGAATFSSTADITGAATVGGTLDVTGITTLDAATYVNGWFILNNKNALIGTDTFLRINNQQEFTSGTYTPGPFRIDDTLTIFDDLGVDSAAFSHNGNNFSTVFTTTDSWRLSGLTGAFEILGDENLIELIPSAAGNNAAIYYQDAAGANIWALSKQNTTAGDDFRISRYNPAGTFVDNPIAIDWATGDVTLTAQLTAASYGGITEANLLDKTAAETISGIWSHEANLRIRDGQSQYWYDPTNLLYFRIYQPNLNTFLLNNQAGANIYFFINGTQQFQMSETGSRIQRESTHVTGTISSTDAVLNLFNRWESDTDEKGAILTFSDNYFSTSFNPTTRAAIKGGTDTTGNTADGFLAFYTDAAGANSCVERMRIDHDGNVGIGKVPTDGGDLLQVAGNIRAENGQILATRDDANAILESQVDGDHFPYIRLQRINGTTKTNRIWHFVIGSSGGLSLTDATGVVSPIVIAAGAATNSVSIGVSSMTFAQATTANSTFDVLGDLTVNDASSLFINSADNAEWLEAYHDGVDAYITTGGTNAGSIIFGKGVSFESTTPTVSTNAVTVNTEAGNGFEIDLEPATATVTVTMSGAPPSGLYYRCRIKFQQDGTTAQSLTWAGGTFVWDGGSAHAMTTTLDGITIYTLETWDGGTTWYASGADYS